jgi:hypothetical protein
MEESHMETIVVAAHRGSTMTSGATLLIVSVVVAAAVAFAVVRHLRSRQQPEA